MTALLVSAVLAGLVGGLLLAAPYNVAVVELDEGPRLHTNVVDCPNEALHVGMPVEVVFVKVDDEVTLPKFRPRAA